MHFLQCSYWILFDVSSVISVIVVVDGVIHSIKEIIFRILMVTEADIFQKYKTWCYRDIFEIRHRLEKIRHEPGYSKRTYMVKQRSTYIVKVPHCHVYTIREYWSAVGMVTEAYELVLLPNVRQSIFRIKKQFYFTVVNIIYKYNHCSTIFHPKRQNNIEGDRVVISMVKPNPEVLKL